MKLYANLRKLTGTKEVPIAQAIVEAVLNELRRQNPPLGDVILENDGLCQHIIITHVMIMKNCVFKS